jgi:hypothetical protein
VAMEDILYTKRTNQSDKEKKFLAKYVPYSHIGK